MALNNISAGIMSSQYVYDGNGPFDAKMLVETLADLKTPSFWEVPDPDNPDEISYAAYNGMLVAVWNDTTNNGLYLLHDGKKNNKYLCETFKEVGPTIVLDTSWHKLASLDDIQALVDTKTLVYNEDGKLELAGLSELEEGKSYVPSILNGSLTWSEAKEVYSKQEVADLINEKLTGDLTVDLTEYAKVADILAIEESLKDKANITDVYSKTEIDNAFITKDQVSNRINEIITQADSSNTINTLDALVSCVLSNTSTITDTNNTVTSLNASIIALNSILEQEAESAEVSLNEEGTALTVNWLDVNKLKQTVGDTLILSGGGANSTSVEN